jgi:tetratricopeptide (TPR) repeat protein
MSKRKVRHKIVTEKEKDKGKPPHIPGWSFKSHRLKFLISLFLVAATLAVFGQVRNHAFINFDDNVYITENPHVKLGLTLKGVVWAFTTMYAANWHPLTWLSHMLDCQLYGLNPAGHHLTNLVFHIVNALLLFFVLKRITRRVWMSGFVAALFALHPLHVESVAWVAERKDVLSTFFWMLTMWMYVHYVEKPGLKRYLLVLLSFALGLLSKPMLVTLPFVLLLLDYWPFGRFQFGGAVVHHEADGSISPADRRISALRLVGEKAPLFLLSALSSIVTVVAQQRGGAVVSLETHSIESRFANALVSYITYIEKMIWPSHLAIFYPYPETFPIWKVAGAGLLLVCLSILVIRAARKRPYLVVGWIWYLGTLVPVIGLVQVGSQAMADRYTYVPLIGLSIIVAEGVPDLLGRWRHRRVALSIFAGLLLSILMTLTKLQVRHWQNDVTLFRHAGEVTTNNHLSHANLGAALFRQGKYQESIIHSREALRIKPDSAEPHNNIGLALAHLGEHQEAIVHWEEALRIKPDFADAHSNLGMALSHLGKYQEAFSHYREALRIKPDAADAHNNLGGELRRLGRHEEAIAHFTEALKIKPDYAEAHGNLGNIFTELGRVEEAITQYNEALRIKSDFAEVRLSLGLAYLRVGNRDSAMKEYEILKKVNPDLANELRSEIYK